MSYYTRGELGRIDITESLVRNIVKEELHFTKGSPFLMHRQFSPAVFDRQYITETLAIKIPLHESHPYSPALQKRILHEHMLFEGFWSELYDKGKEKLMSAADGIKKFGKEAWSILSAMWTVIKGGAGEIASFTGAIAKKGINKFFQQIRKPLEWLVENLPKWNMPTFAEWAQKGLDALTAAGEKVESLDGWKRVIGFAGLAIGLHWLWEKVGDWVDELKEKIGGDFEEGLKFLSEAEGDDEGDSSKMDAVKEWIKDTITDKLKALAGDAFSGIMEKLAGAFTGVKPWWDAAVKIAGGAKLVIDALGSAATRFLARQQKLIMPGESGGGTETQSEGLIREYIKEAMLIRNEGHTQMRISERQLRRVIREALITEKGLCKSPPGSLTISGPEEGEEEVLAEDDLEEYSTWAVDTSGRTDTSRRDKKPTGEEMGCKDRRTGKTVEPYWQQRMGKWVCP